MNNAKANKFNEILDIDLKTSDLTICMASLKEEMPIFQKLQISDQLSNEFRLLLETSLGKYKKDAKNKDLIFHNYDASTLLSPHEIEYLDLSVEKYLEIKSQIELLSSIADLGIFNAEELFIKNLRFYVIIVQPSKNRQPIYFFRLYSSKKELSRSLQVTAIFSEGHFDRLKHPTFLFDQYIDCIASEDSMFILSKDKFHKIFRYFEMILKLGKTTLSKIKEYIPISNFEEFQESCESHLLKLQKLRSISEKNYISKVTINDLKKVIKEYKLPIKVVEKDGKECLLFDSENKWAILSLLDDNYLQSILTGQNYEVGSKRELV